MTGTPHRKPGDKERDGDRGAREAVTLHLVRLRPKRQITLPVDLVELFNVDEGDMIEITSTDNAIVLRPKKLIDSKEAWFWTSQWQAKEKGADADLQAKRVRVYEGYDAWLDSLADR